jgi:hypothetical protein
MNFDMDEVLLNLYYYIAVGRRSYNAFGEGDLEHLDRTI